MTLASPLSPRATRLGLQTFLFWWRLPAVTGPRKALIDRIGKARRAHKRNATAHLKAQRAQLPPNSAANSGRA